MDECDIDMIRILDGLQRILREIMKDVRRYHEIAVKSLIEESERE